MSPLKTLTKAEEEASAIIIFEKFLAKIHFFFAVAVSSSKKVLSHHWGQVEENFKIMSPKT